MIDYYMEFWRNYFNFQGRSRRAAFWSVWLMNIIIVVILSVLSTFVPLVTYVYGLYGLAALIPQLSLSVRRLHDTGRSGWWLLLLGIPAAGRFLLSLLPYNLLRMGAIIVLIAALVATISLIAFFCQDSDGQNSYGPSPKYASEPEQGYKPPESGFYK